MFLLIVSTVVSGNTFRTYGSLILFLVQPQADMCRETEILLPTSQVHFFFLCKSSYNITLSCTQDSIFKSLWLGFPAISWLLKGLNFSMTQHTCLFILPPEFASLGDDTSFTSESLCSMAFCSALRIPVFEYECPHAHDAVHNNHTDRTLPSGRLIGFHNEHKHNERDESWFEY